MSIIANAPDPSWLHGVDLSHWQDAAWVPWSAIRQTSQFAIVKLSDGGHRDPACVRMVQRARDANLIVGGYHFWREGIDVQAQVNVFHDAALDCRMSTGDILPTLDLEYPSDTRKLTPASSDPARRWCELVSELYGGAVVYLSQNDWHNKLGAPDWPRAYPLWCPHYRGHASAGPATPGDWPWAIWQYNGTAPYKPGEFTLHHPADRHSIDLNYAQRLPLIHLRVAGEPTTPCYLTRANWGELIAGRDREVQGG